MEVRINGLFHLLRKGVYWGYNLLTNLLLTSWDIQVAQNFRRIPNKNLVTLPREEDEEESGQKEEKQDPGLGPGYRCFEGYESVPRNEWGFAVINCLSGKKPINL